MICKNCGKENPNNVIFCSECGKELSRNQENIETATTSKKGIGILFFLFGGFLGLIAGLLLYPINTIERKTFVAGCVSCVIALVIIIVFFSLICVPLLVEYL